MKLALLFLAFTCSLASANPALDPFGPGNAPSWLQSIDAAKPLRLEICFDEINHVKNVPAEQLITPEFLAAAKTLRIAVAADDQGRVEAPGPLAATYRLTTKDGAHSLDLLLALGGENRREINTSVTITDQWIVFGGLTRTEVTTTTDGKTTETVKNLIIAVRLVPAKP